MDCPIPSKPQVLPSQQSPILANATAPPLKGPHCSCLLNWTLSFLQAHLLRKPASTVPDGYSLLSTFCMLRSHGLLDSRLSHFQKTSNKWCKDLLFLSHLSVVNYLFPAPNLFLNWHDWETLINLIILYLLQDISYHIMNESQVMEVSM